MNERTVDDDAPISPADALAIIDEERSRAPSLPGLYYVLWGPVLLVIGLAWFLAGFGTIGYVVAGVVTGVVVVVGFVGSAVVGVRLGRGVSGPSNRQGLMLGMTWLVVFALLSVLIGSLGTLGLDDQQTAHLIPALYGMTSGALYMLMGAIWRHVAGYLLGVVIMAAAVASVFAPLPWNSLVIGVGIGGSILAVGCQQIAKGRR